MKKLMTLVSATVVGAAIVTGPFFLILGPSNETDGFKLLLGMSQDELVRAGAVAYPEEGRGHNHACHRLAARLTTEKYGAAIALAGGVFNEIAESSSLALMGQNPLTEVNISETLGDFGANWRGVKDALIRTPHPSAGR